MWPRSVLTVLLVSLLCAPAWATEMTVTWEHDGSGEIDATTGQLVSPLDRFNVYQSSTETGAYALTHSLPADRRSQVVEMGHEPTTWVRMTAIARSGVESFPSAPISKTLPPPVNLSTRMLDANRVEIMGKAGACRVLKTTGSGLKRIVTCVP